MPSTALLTPNLPLFFGTHPDILFRHCGFNMTMVKGKLGEKDGRNNNK